MTIIPIVLNVGMGYVENLSRPMVIIMAILPALVALLVYGYFRSTRTATFRVLALLPLGAGIMFGIYALQDLSRPGVREYGDIGMKTFLIYIAILVVPILAGVFIAIRELNYRRSDYRRHAR